MKVRLIRLLSDFREVDHTPVKRTPLKPVMLYLMQLRSHIGEADLAKKKLVIPIELKESANLPQPVRITHVPPNEISLTANPPACPDKLAEAFPEVPVGSA